MAKTDDMTKIMKDMMGAFPVDMSSLQETFKTQASLGDKMSKVAVEAAEKSTELSSKWTKATLAKVAEFSAVKDEPTDYTNAMTAFASAQAELATENMAAFAEIAKKVQMETVELMLAAGKDMGDDMTAAAKKATEELSSVAKKATDEVTAAAKKATAK
ncbi:phasin family protein [Celeribacter sp.]|uniref:phasin family protein n=1 Tax=Celeribacter sp. TaxID=1890673 RepID=UPI003A9276E9